MRSGRLSLSFLEGGIWLIFGILSHGVVRYKALRLHPCDSSGYIEVIENKTVTLACDQYSGRVTWSSVSSTIGKCNATSCEVPIFPLFSLTYNNASSSSFTSTSTSRAVGTSIFQCSELTTGNVTSCRLHVIVPAVLGTLNITESTPSAGWMVSGDVTISKVYSSRELYTCVWSVKQDNGQYTEVVTKTPTFDPVVANTSDRTGHCDFTDQPLPSNSGTYTFRVVVSPGQTSATDSSVVIVSPPQPTNNCGSSDYVSEGSDVSCTCSGSVGRPPGRLVWLKGNTPIKVGTYGDVSLMLTVVVNRTDNGDVLRCDVDWITQTEGSPYTLLIAYGPDNVTIPQSPVFYTDSSGSRDLTLTCEPRDVNPTSYLNFSWTAPCADVTSNTCSFRPQPPGGAGSDDVNALIRCTVTNLRANRNKTGDFRLQLKYPPHEPPEISGYTSSAILYEGDLLTLTCTVVGGDPVMTSVTLTCGEAYSNTSMGQQTIVSVTSLQSSDHDALCTCSGQWIRPEYYNLTDNVTLTVFSPPSRPIITRTDGSTHTPVEGDNMTLTCTVTSSGHPEVNLTWTGQRTGTISRPDKTSSTLRMTSLQRSDNSKVIRCRASNAFTVYKQQTLEDTETLHVYYGPYITLSKSDGDNCVMSSDTCTIREGQRLHLRCDVDSNPFAQGCVWHSYTTDNSGTSAATTLNISTVLDISSVNRSHGGVYHVTAETTKSDVTDTRLPLTSQFNLTVLVQYPPTDTALYVAGNKTMTVNENEAVTFTCHSNGRPNPKLRLEQRSKDETSSQQNGGERSLVEDDTWLNLTLTAQCNNTGNYTCTADNRLGSVQEDYTTLFVNCKPRKLTETGAPTVANFITDEISLPFDLEAFPLPSTYHFLYHGMNNNRSVNQPVTSDQAITLEATCVNTFAAYAVTCTVTVQSVKDQSAAGFYTFRAENAFGHEDFPFEVKVNASTYSPGQQTESPDIGAAVGGGIGAAVIVVLGVVVGVILWKRRQKAAAGKNETRRSAHNAPTRQERHPDIVGTVNPDYSTVEQDDGVIVADHADSLSSQARPVRRTVGAYDDVDLGEEAAGPAPASQAQAAPTETSDVYATVNKEKKTSPPTTASGAGDSDVYATVDKSKKSGVTPGQSGVAQKPAVKPKPAKKANDKSKVKGKGKKSRTEDTADKPSSERGATPSRRERDEGTVYENYAFQTEEVGLEGNTGETPPGLSSDGSQADSPVGPVYTTIAFSEEQMKKAEKPPPSRDATEYAAINFVETAALAAKSNE